MEMLGRLIARMHAVGSRHLAHYRMQLSGDTYGTQEIQFLETTPYIPEQLKPRYVDVARRIIGLAVEWMRDVPTQRIHGDLHIGNLLSRKDSFLLVDFDDMAIGPVVQDIWLLSAGRDEETQRLRERMIQGYEVFRPFPRETLRLIEPLRALRMIRYAAWIARRWNDPIFPQMFPHFGTERYWAEAIYDLQEAYEVAVNGANNMYS